MRQYPNGETIMENKEKFAQEDMLGIEDLIAENIDQVSAGNANFWQHQSNETCMGEWCF